MASDATWTNEGAQARSQQSRTAQQTLLTPVGVLADITSTDRPGGPETLLELDELIREGGFLFVSNDDHEHYNRRKVCDDLFGEENVIAQFVRNTEGHTDNQFDVKVNHE